MEQNNNKNLQQPSNQDVQNQGQEVNERKRSGNSIISIKGIISLAIIVAVVIIALRIGLPSIDLGGYTKDRIVPTNTILRESKKIAKLTTATYNDDFVYVYREYLVTGVTNARREFVNLNDAITEDQNGNIILKDSLELFEEIMYGHYYPAETDQFSCDSTDNVICYIFRGATVRAGYDLSKIRPNGIKTEGDMVIVNLPEIEIFDAVINPSNYEVFDKYGSCWTAEIESEIFKEAKEDLVDKALSKGLLETAEKSGEKVLTALFKSFGYSDVILVPYEDWCDDEFDRQEQSAPITLPVE